MALPTRVGSCNISFAVDTGAAVIVLSQESYKALKRNARGVRYMLLGVTGSALQVLGMVTLPIYLTKEISAMEFYVATNFKLLSDRILGLLAMKSNRIGINPDSNSIIYRGRELQALQKPMTLVSQVLRSLSCEGDKSRVGQEAGASNVVPSIHATRIKFDPCEGWRKVIATVVEDHVIPD